MIGYSYSSVGAALERYYTLWGQGLSAGSQPMQPSEGDAPKRQSGDSTTRIEYLDLHSVVELLSREQQAAVFVETVYHGEHPDGPKGGENKQERMRIALGRGTTSDDYLHWVRTGKDMLRDEMEVRGWIPKRWSREREAATSCVGGRR